MHPNNNKSLPSPPHPAPVTMAPTPTVEDLKRILGGAERQLRAVYSEPYDLEASAADTPEEAKHLEKCAKNQAEQGMVLEKEILELKKEISALEKRKRDTPSVGGGGGAAAAE